MHGNKPYRVASIADSAMDCLEMGSKAPTYARTRDTALVKEVPGRQLMWFTCRRLTEDEMEWVDLAASENARYKRAFQLGVSLVENARLTDGRTIGRYTQSGGKQYLSGGGVVDPCWGEDELELISRALKVDIGAVVYWRSFLAHESEPYCQVPQLSQDAAMALANRLADEREKVIADPSSGTPSDPGAPSSDERSEPSTAVTAKAKARRKRRG